MKLLLLVAFVGLAAAARPSIFRNGREFKPIEEYYKQYPDKYPLFQEVENREGSAGRVVGGTEAEPTQIPYQAALLVYSGQGSFFCGGVIIGVRHVLTAAHCLPQPIYWVEIILGATNIRVQEPQQRQYLSLSPLYHPDFESRTLNFDIGLININQGMDIAFSPFIQMAPLPSKRLTRTNVEGQTGTVSGWGFIADDQPETTSILRFAQNEIVTLAKCRATYGDIVTDRNICMSGAERRGACNGDSGGPLTIEIDERKTLVGLVSFGAANACEQGWETAFTYVPEFINWIEEESVPKLTFPE